MKTPFRSYAEAYSDFRWEVPKTFNFGRDVVDAIAIEDPGRLALIWCDAEGAEERFTYADMSRLSNQVANLLESLGVNRGDRVIVMLPRVPQWQISMVACIKLGAIPIPCIDMLTEKDIAYRVANSGAVAVITTAAQTTKFQGCQDIQVRIAVGAAAGWLDFQKASASQSTFFECADVAAEEPALLFYTSGSTGLPKGVLHAARALYGWRVSAWCWLDLEPGDLMWCTADTGWAKAGTSILFGPWSRGATVLFYNGPFDAQVRLQLIEKYGVTVFCAAATEFRRLVKEDLRSSPMRRLRLAVSAGESVNPEVLDQWERITGIPLREAYGLTETLMIVGTHRSSAPRPGSMGRAMPGSELCVFRPDGQPAQPGETGELALRLPHPLVMMGYWQDPIRSAATQVKYPGISYFLTGDLVHFDEDNYVYYDARADDIISTAGYRVGPMEVENVLMEHPAVMECAVVGSPDPERGEIVKAFVVLSSGYRAGDQLTQELQEHAKQNTAPYKYPRAIAYVSDLPKNASGKVLRRVLRDAEHHKG